MSARLQAIHRKAPGPGAGFFWAPATTYGAAFPVGTRASLPDLGNASWNLPQRNLYESQGAGGSLAPSREPIESTERDRFEQRNPHNA